MSEVIPLALSGFTIGVAHTVVPGPVNAEASRRGPSQGFGSALSVQLGSLLGDILWAILGLNQVAATDAMPRDRYGLTARERDVLSLITRGHPDSQIAEALYISRDTAKTHARNILRKLGVSTRVAAVAVAHREKLVPVEE